MNEGLIMCIFYRDKIFQLKKKSALLCVYMCVLSSGVKRRYVYKYANVSSSCESDQPG